VLQSLVTDGTITQADADRFLAEIADHLGTAPTV
jgi:hypothetical protein